jgi:hypothetical protein
MSESKSARKVKAGKGAAKAPVVNAPVRKGSAKAKAADLDLKNGAANSNAPVAIDDSRNGIAGAPVAEGIKKIAGDAKPWVTNANTRKGSTKARVPVASAKMHKRAEEVPLGRGDKSDGSANSSVAKTVPQKRIAEDREPVANTDSQKGGTPTGAPVASGDTGGASAKPQVVNDDPRKASASPEAPAGTADPEHESARSTVASSRPGTGSARPPVANANLSGFLGQIARRVDQGEVARKVLVNHLAKLSIEELRTVSPTIIGRLGPAGLAELVRVSAGLRTRAAALAVLATDRTPAVASESKPIAPWRQWLLREPLPWQMAKSLIAFVVAAIVLVNLVPLLERSVFGPPVVDGVASCGQLDIFTGDCVYHTGTGRLTMERAAEALNLPVDVLAAANPNLSPSVPILSGASLRIPARPILNLR